MTYLTPLPLAPLRFLFRHNDDIIISLTSVTIVLFLFHTLSYRFDYYYTVPDCFVFHWVLLFFRQNLMNDNDNKIGYIKRQSNK